MVEVTTESFKNPCDQSITRKDADTEMPCRLSMQTAALLPLKKECG